MSGSATRHTFGLVAVAAGGITSVQLFATLGSPASEGRALRACSTCEVERKQAVTGSGGLSRNSMGMSSIGALGLSMAIPAIAHRAAGGKNRRAASAVSLKAFENELGVQAPVGYWDPLGYAADGDAELFRRRREIEIKHGRVSMLACMGYIVPEYLRWPGFCSPSDKLAFADIPNGLAALKVMPVAGVLQLFAFAGHIEVKFLTQDPSREPGDFENCGIFGVPNRGEGVIVGKLKEPSRIKDEAARKTKLNAELANGRLAMMAIMGMFFQDGLTGSAWGDWAMYDASPLRSGKMSPGFNTLPEFEKPSTGFQGLLGDQPPLGFWDPVGFSKDGDLEKFKRRREVEIKHGRVSMLATIGYMVPEYVKLPGYLSPSMELSFQDVPNGLGALSKVPTAGWAQIFAFVGAIELGYNKQTGEPGNYGKGFLGLGSVGVSASIEDPEVRSKKLSAELANGRLAMMAIIGMFFQDGLTGSAWGDWANYVDSPLRARS